jgi:acyl-[acyl-carrier-protein] desaturase
MADITPTVCPELEGAFWRMYRDFFDLAEKKRRWSIRDDIPWDRCGRVANPALADVLESYCAVELYLPDYTSKILPVVRPSKGRTWFYANWGYEESKHSLVLADWLLKSGMRDDGQMMDLERMVFERHWNLPQDSHLGMLVYAMVQELATWLNHRNLRHHAEGPDGDPALAKLLMYLSVDERALQFLRLVCETLPEVRQAGRTGADAARDESVRDAGHRRSGRGPRPRRGDQEPGHFRSEPVLPRRVSTRPARSRRQPQRDRSREKRPSRGD